MLIIIIIILTDARERNKTLERKRKPSWVLMNIIIFFLRRENSIIKLDLFQYFLSKHGRRGPNSIKNSTVSNKVAKGPPTLRSPPRITL